MTATLRLRLRKDLGGATTTVGAVANLYAIDEFGQPAPKRDRRDVLIPAGYGVAPLELEIEPGMYLIEASLPSGDVASEQVRLADQTVTVVDLEAAHSSHEWLSWQQYVGNVPAAAEIERRTKRPARAPRKAETTQFELVDDFLRSGSYSGPMFRRSGSGCGCRCSGVCGPRVGSSRRAKQSSDTARQPAPSVARTAAWPMVWLVDHPVDTLRGVGAGSEAWKLVVAAETRSDPLGALSAGKPRRARLGLHDRDVAVLNFGAAGLVADEQRDPGRGGPTPRRYVVAERARGVAELVCLPVPWDSGPADRVPIQVLLRRRPLPGEAMLATSSLDPNVGPAIGYMGSGALSKARLVVDQAADLLYGKQINPFGAAAGGYVLLATMEGVKDQVWFPWIANLANWFDFLPDGMIQYGRLLLHLRRSKADVEQAGAAFFAAYDRGIPYYSLGLQWLIEGLSLLATRDEEARRRLAGVQEVAWRANLQQPFTTIRLRG